LSKIAKLPQLHHIFTNYLKMYMWIAIILISFLFWSRLITSLRVTL